jgi:hypothetical protein
MLHSGERVRFSRLPEREPEFDSDLDEEEEEDRRNEEDDEDEELDRQERQDDEDDENDDDIYSDDMTASSLNLPRRAGDKGNTRVGCRLLCKSKSRENKLLPTRAG